MRKLNVAILEDMDSDYELVSFYLKKSKKFLIQTQRFITLESTLEAYDDGAITADIILMDLNLPDSDYRHTMYTALNRMVNIPIIVLTSMDLTLGYEAIKLGAQDFINKSELKNAYLDYKLEFSLERYRQNKRMQELAFVDKATGLYTMSFLKHYIEQMGHSDEGYGILMSLSCSWQTKKFNPMGNGFNQYLISELKYMLLEYDLFIASDYQHHIYILYRGTYQNKEVVLETINGIISEASRLYPLENLSVRIGEQLLTKTNDFSGVIDEINSMAKEVIL